MLNLRTDVPVKQNIIDEIQNRLALVRDVTLEIEQLLRIASKEPRFLTKHELAEMLRCDEKNIPPKFRKLGRRVGSSYIYPEADVFELLDVIKR